MTVGVTPDLVAVQVPVAQVVVSEDRAQITRRGIVHLRAGRNRLVVEGVAPVLVDKSLGASLSSGALVELHVERRRKVVPGAQREEVRTLDARIESALRERTAEASRNGHLREQLERHGEAGDLAAAEIAQDVGWGDRDPKAWTARLMAGREPAWRVAEALVRSNRTVERLDHSLALLRARRAQLDSPSTELDARIVLVVDAEADSEASVVLDYVVPAACWRPMHRARLVEGSDSALVFEVGAVVWQCTGERWSGVTLALSTERPSLGESPPTLVDDWLQLKKIGSQVVVEARESRVETTGMGAGRRVVQELPGIDDRGEARHITLEGAHDVESDGRPHPLTLGSFRVEATVRRVVLAELAPAVLFATSLHNPGPATILPGPVELVRAGGIVGQTTIDYTAAGERFELGWGPDKALRVTREEDEEDLDTTLLSGWRRKRKTVVLRLSNLGPDRVNLQVTERIPVSEIDKVQIELERAKCTGNVTSDGDGFLRWERTLAPFGRDEVRVSYVISVHPDVSGLPV